MLPPDGLGSWKRVVVLETLFGRFWPLRMSFAPCSLPPRPSRIVPPVFVPVLECHTAVVHYLKLFSEVPFGLSELADSREHCVTLALDECQHRSDVITLSSNFVGRLLVLCLGSLQLGAERSVPLGYRIDGVLHAVEHGLARRV